MSIEEWSEKDAAFPIDWKEIVYSLISPPPTSCSSLRRAPKNLNLILSHKFSQPCYLRSHFVQALLRCVHESIITSASPVFQVMLTNGMKESVSDCEYVNLEGCHELNVYTRNIDWSSKETFSTGRYAEIEIEEKEFTDDEAAYWKKTGEVIYKSFVKKAADARGKTYEEMHGVAQGRVWTGKQALERGLIGHIGGLRKAIEVAKTHAQNITGDKEEGNFVNVRTIAEPQGFEKLFTNDDDEIYAQAPSAERSFGLGAPLAIAEVGPLLTGPSPLSSFLFEAVAAATGDASVKFRTLFFNHGTLVRVIGNVLRNVLANSMNR